MSLLRNGFRPKVTAWLLVLSLPSMLAITQVTSLGSADLPVAFGWAIAGSHLLATRQREVVGSEHVPGRAG